MSSGFLKKLDFFEFFFVILLYKNCFLRNLVKMMRGEKSGEAEKEEVMGQLLRVFLF